MRAGEEAVQVRQHPRHPEVPHHHERQLATVQLRVGTDLHATAEEAPVAGGAEHQGLPARRAAVDLQDHVGVLVTDQRPDRRADEGHLGTEGLGRLIGSSGDGAGEAERARESNSHTQAPRRGASDRSGSSARSTWRLRPTRTRAGGGAAGATGHRAGVGRDHLWGWIASTRWFVGPWGEIWHDARIVVVDETARQPSRLRKSVTESHAGSTRQR